MNAQWIQLLAGLPPIADAALKMTAILVLGWLAHAALARCNPRWRVVLWRGVAVSLIAAPLLVLVMPAVRIAIARPAAPVNVTMAEIQQQAMPEAPEARSALDPMSAASGATVKVESPSWSDAARWLRRHFPATLAGLWVTVAIAQAFRVVRALRTVRRIVRRSSAAPRHAQQNLEEIAAQLGCRRDVALRMADGVPSPFLCGAFRPVIMLPRAMAGEDYREELPAILAHELAHTRSRDVLWGLLVQGLQIAVWPHPLAWRMRAAHAAACEEVCDALAAATVGDALSYSGTLARVALDLRVRTVTALNVIPMARVADVRRRIEFLKRRIYNMPIAKKWMIAAVFTGLLVITGITGIKISFAETIVGKSIGGQVMDKTSSVATLSGVVKDKQGAPVEGAEVGLYLTNFRAMEHKYLTSLTTKADGKFLFDNVPQLSANSGTYFTVMGSKPGLAWYGYVINSYNKDDLVTLRLGEASPLAGQIVNHQGQPVAGATVYCIINPGGYESIYVVPGWEKYACRTDATGHFRFAQLPANKKVNLTVIHPDYAITTGPVDTRTYDGGVDTGTENFRLEMEAAGTIEGQIVDADGSNRPLAGIRLFAENRRLIAWGNTVLTDAEGRFSFKNMPAGGYAIKPLLTTEQAQNSVVYTAYPVRLAEGQTTEGIKMEWIEGVPLRGQVLDSSTNQPIANAAVTVNQNVMRTSQRIWTGYTATDTQGYFELRVPPGNGSVSASAFNYVGNGSASESALNIQPGDTHAEVALFLRSNKPIAVSGVVLDPEGKPAGGVVVSSTSYQNEKTTTTADGRFRLDVRAESFGRPETMSVTALAPDKDLVGTAAIPQDAKSSVTLEIKLKPAGAVTGQVVDEAKDPLAGARITLLNRIAMNGRGFMLRSMGQPIQTDKQGKFRISGMIDGELYTIRCEYESHGTMTDNNLKGEAGHVIDKGVIVLPLADCFVELTALDESGKPVDGMRIFANGQNQPMQDRMRQTDKDGKLRMGPFVAGELFVQGSKSGYSPAPARVNLESGKTAKVELKVTRAGSSQGPTGTITSVLRRIMTF